MREQIIQLFKNKSKGGHFLFLPEIKVRRERDILFLYEMLELNLSHSSPSYHVILEKGTEDKIRMPLSLLDDSSLKAIYFRLQGAKVLEIERIK